MLKPTNFAENAAPIFEPRRIRRIACITPPSGRPICRDYFCTSSSKSGYYWHPIDLWIQGAYLQNTHEVRLFEGVRVPANTLLNRISDFHPDLILILVGGFSLNLDLAFLNQLANKLNVPIIVGGESVFRGREFWRNQHGVVALMTGFAGNGLLTALEGRGWGSGFSPLHDGADGTAHTTTSSLPAELSWGPPTKWELQPYRYPLLGRPFASVLTSYGCPFLCSYCNNNHDILGLSLRNLDDLFLELDTWLERGVRWLHFHDVNFGGNKGRAVKILSEMIRRRYPFRWNAFIRPEMVDKEMASLLKQAGCVQIQMGVESANPVILKNVSRNGRFEAIASAFHNLEQVGIRRGAHFVLGLPGENESDVKASIDFAIALNPDYASFNVGITRGGTKFDHGKTPGDCSAPQQDGLIGDISHDQALKLQKTAIRRFYGRPRFLLKTAKTMLKSPTLTSGIISDGWSLLRP